MATLVVIIMAEVVVQVALVVAVELLTLVQVALAEAVLLVKVIMVVHQMDYQTIQQVAAVERHK